MFVKIASGIATKFVRTPLRSSDWPKPSVPQNIRCQPADLRKKLLVFGLRRGELDFGGPMAVTVMLPFPPVKLSEQVRLPPRWNPLPKTSPSSSKTTTAISSPVERRYRGPTVISRSNRQYCSNEP